MESMISMLATISWFDSLVTICIAFVIFIVGLLLFIWVCQNKMFHDLNGARTKGMFMGMGPYPVVSFNSGASCEGPCFVQGMVGYNGMIIAHVNFRPLGFRGSK